MQDQSDQSDQPDQSEGFAAVLDGVFCSGGPLRSSSSLSVWSAAAPDPSNDSVDAAFSQWHENIEMV